MELTICSPEQIMIGDDPAFNPDMAFPAFDLSFGLLGLDEAPAGDSQHSTQSMLSIRDRSGSVSSLHSGPSINLPSSSHGGGFQSYDHFGSSVQKDNQVGGAGRNEYLQEDEEGLMYEDDPPFEFDEDGEMRDVDPKEQAASRAVLGSDSTALGHVRKDHEDAAAADQVHPAIVDADGDLQMPDYGDDLAALLPDAEPFSVAGSGSQRPGLLDPERFSQSELSSSPSAVAAPQKRRRKANRPRKLLPDPAGSIELRSADLITWQKNYLANMAAARQLITTKKANQAAKKNADYWVFGFGINGVGEPAAFESPLSMFAGAALLARITGVEVPPATPKGKKRAHHSDVEEESAKRSRHENSQLEDEMARGYEDDLIIQHSSPEVGRDAPSALHDAPSSAVFPWNVSASMRSHSQSIAMGRGVSSSIRGALPSHRLTSASPLQGRGPQYGDENEVMYGRSDNDVGIDHEDDAGLQDTAPSGSGNSQAAEFELYGAAAAVDTQTAASQGWIASVLDREAGNFYEFVVQSIKDKQEAKQVNPSTPTGSQMEGDGERDEPEHFVTFDDLFEAEPTTSKIVAAQAFYHILTLATKGRIWAEQDVPVEDGVEMPFGEIRIGAIENIWARD